MSSGGSWGLLQDLSGGFAPGGVSCRLLVGGSGRTQSRELRVSVTIYRR